ncbi:phenylalanine--tRNA ligase subunit beta [Campylobacter fetus]|uniref:Phenylalanine--tRNA ligase beta subunit n=1 Tax=Campylobacter fetus subsp. testudinum TaxID=1507806 RepID=A0AAX0HF01_CAMFE|nr:phenylalanine--tRNA ligase subunit beta [Campylobacter fetus]AVK81510.1 phenylalanine--tRNA ligase subunit beta [Campylobacter fetus subsp. testudinum]MPB71812.1 phenylalanine--tRNA ligase subunit beta [Campylobacter fetus]MPB77250.1 phenylalanine--tRNA ligase subunit beta [Campylobacter fetus]OCR87336.1 phenylalanyl-tRNA synthetase subunit beta [Campylobacter fetus subsp. testudinum]OCR88926.1 phenylalanyl-tRNA synthetase subunit beta [Campylobacter fetus subsp. testudinum]
MIISKNWLNEWVDVSHISTETICDKLNSIGLEVDSLKSIAAPKKVVVGKVKTCVEHENSDHLHVCEVDVGTEVLQIVCGAKNVASGQFVVCALVGATMPNGLEIKSAKLRGVASFGMLCSSSELGLAKINDGIMVLDDSIGELVLGKELREYAIFNDDIIEIDLTPNRGDCLSINGIARDLSVALDIPMRDRTSREEEEKLLGIGRILSIHCDEKINGSFLYRAIELKDDFEISLKTDLRLALIDCSKTNSIQKVLEYVTYSTGVLFRAYDYHKIAKDDEDKINIDIKIEPNGSYGVYSGGKCLGQAGIWQTEEARLDEYSRVIIIEASYTEPDVISSAVGGDKKQPKDDATYRSSRGSEPKLSIGMDLLFDLFSKNKKIAPYAGAQQILLEKEQTIVSFNCPEICNMIGSEISRNDIIKILKKLGFDITFNVEQEQIYARVPFYRHDINNTHDICEEIVRIVGIDNIPSTPLIFSEKNRINPTFESYKYSKYLRHKAAMAGFFECVHYIFDNAEELETLGFKPSCAEILNPINNELSVLKPTLINHLLNSCERNVKNSKRSVKLFEFGDVFDEVGIQSSKFGFVASGLANEPTLLNGAKPAEIDFFTFANLIQDIVGKIELKNGKNIGFLSEFEQASIYKNGNYIGYIGRLDLNLELKRDLLKTYVCELDFDKIKFGEKIAKNYSKFPSISRDLSFIVPKNLPYIEIKNCIENLNILTLKEFLPVDLYSDETLGDKVSLSVKFTFQDMQKTLEDEEIADIIDKILTALNDKLGIGLR